MTVFAIAGSGFGIYGYLPALLDTIASQIILPEAYKEKVMARPELCAYLNKIIWEPNFDYLIQNVENLVVAKMPANQTQIVTNLLKSNKIKQLFLEKPLVPNSKQAGTFLSNLIQSKIKFRIGYTFLYTPWFVELLKAVTKISRKTEISISWQYKAHHFANELYNWKRCDDQGGGVLRFYGIHIIALLAALGYSVVIQSKTIHEIPGQSKEWHATFQGELLPICSVKIDSRALKNQFSINIDDICFYNSKDPFETLENKTEDRRVAVLRTFCGTMQLQDSMFYNLYQNVNSLWEKAELVNTVHSRHIEQS